MKDRLFMVAVFAVLACIGAQSRGQSPEEDDSDTSDCRGEATYTSNSTGVPFDVSFDFALRDQSGVDRGWAIARTSATPGVGFNPGYAAAARIHSVEFHGNIAIFVSVWERGTSGALGMILGLGTNEIAGVASIIGLRDGNAGGLPDQVSEAFFWPPSQVPTNPNDLLDVEALDDFGQPFPGFEGTSVRNFILAQLAGNTPNRPPFPIHPGGDIQISGGP